MSTGQFQRVKEVFQTACEMHDGARAEYLAIACAGDDSLRQQVDALLQVEFSETKFLESPVVDGEQFLQGTAAMLDGHESEPVPVSIGRYRVVRLIAEGGMGSVYEAQQDTPRRRVAVKTVRPGLQSPKLRDRLRHEAEILGRLHHDGIAQIHDAGVATILRSDGSTSTIPYFAMEYVAGVPLTDYARRVELSDANRLALLAEVCDAVHYGHLQSVIHRDLKPANILIQESGAVKVIDFGVARVTDSDIAITTLHANAGQILGTLAYMSPEQLSASQAVDARSDVYSLGVIGYELLGNQLPFDLAGLLVPQATRIIQESEPQRLSSISRVFRGDIETIIGKAMEKDPGRRYQSAIELAADIRRFLANEPIVARAPTLKYHFGKFARRHKELVAGFVLVFLVLLCGIVGTTIGLIRADHALSDAEKENRTARRVSSILTNMLGAADPGAPGGGRDVRVADLLDRAMADLGQESAGAPDVEMEIRLVLGDTYYGLGLWDKATVNVQRALELCRQLHGAEHPRTLAMTATLSNCMNEVAGPEALAKREALLADALSIAKHTLPENDLTSLQLSSALGMLRASQGQFEESITILRDALARYQSTPPSKSRESEIGLIRFEIAWNLERLYRHAESEVTLREALAAETAANPNGPIDQFGRARQLLSKVVLAQGRMDEALQLRSDILEDRRQVYGSAHPLTIEAVQENIILLTGMQRVEECLPLYRELLVYRRGRAEIDPDHLSDLLLSMASAMAFLEQYNEATERYQELMDFRQKLGGVTDPRGLLAWRNACLDLGLRAHGEWGSESILLAVRCAIAPVFFSRTPSKLDYSVINWNNMTYRLRKWEQSGSDETAQWSGIDEGDREALIAHSEMEPGLYELSIDAPTREPQPVSERTLILASDWQVDSYSLSFNPANQPDKWSALIASTPHRTYHIPSLCWITGPSEESRGPKREPAMFGLVISTTLDLPAGEYSWSIQSDDGVRMCGIL